MSINRLRTHGYIKRTVAIGGFSLVELMIAVMIGLILIAVVGQSFLTGKATYQTEEGLSRIQENARFAVDFMSRDIRMAGFLGCLGRGAFNSGPIFDHLDVGGAGINTDPLLGYEYTGVSPGNLLTDWTPNLPAAYFNDNEVLPGTDVLVIQRASEDAIAVEPPEMVTASADLKVTANSGLVQGEVVLVSDCESADLFQITNANPDTSGQLVHNTGATVSPGNKTMSLSKVYTVPKSSVFRLLTQIYYIANRPGTTVPALYRKTQQTVMAGAPAKPTAMYQAEELIENVESMHIEYARDLNDATMPISRQIMNAASIPPPPSAIGWPRVTSVRVGLLLRSDNNADQTPDTRSYTIAHKTIPAANDLRRRRAFNFTVQLRN